MKCKICCDNNVGPAHELSENHLKNEALHDYAKDRKTFTGNRKGVIVTCDVKSSFSTFVENAEAKIKISAKPNEELKFKFNISNNSNKDEILVVFIQIPNNKLHFCMNDHGLAIGAGEPQCLKPKKKLQTEVYVRFQCPDIGQYEMPISFLFLKKENNENILMSREMIVYIELKQTVHQNVSSPYAQKDVKADMLVRTNMRNNSNSRMFPILKNHKFVYASALKPRKNALPAMKEIASDISEVFANKVTKENYVRFFHNLLWYEETIVQINLKNYNMSGILLTNHGDSFSLFVPGLTEKRPSLMLGDLLFIKPQLTDAMMFEGVISEIKDNQIIISGVNKELHKYYKTTEKFDVRFFMSRLPFERMHLAVHNIIKDGHENRVFPERNPQVPKVTPIQTYYNLQVESNPEQRQAVERVVAGTAGVAPFLLHGPPGTGKTVTIVEAMLQVISKSRDHRVLVCTDSNMAADHVATLLIKYAHMFGSDFLRRANSKHRVWQTLPECLWPYSNGFSVSSFHSMSVRDFLSFRIVITTLSHAAKFAKQFKDENRSRPISHLFIDEAAQASEPAALIPVAGLLRARGCLLLAGDHKQLGPCVISHHARALGLGVSLMERLKQLQLYTDEQSGDYGLMLRRNFRSSADILALPNELFYEHQLKALAQEDTISTKCILGLRDRNRAIVFHGVLSKEQKMGKSPSYYNTMELEVVQMYVKALINDHRVRPADIGIVTPYVRQVYKIKSWLQQCCWERVEVGTVEAFQGKEKRVVLVSTVRANCALLDYDARFQLGFLVDDKRFNVALTRAKAKLIIIGNPLCLEKDVKWRKYIDMCRAFGTHYGFDAEMADGSATQKDVIDGITPMMKSLKLETKKNARSDKRVSAQKF